ncbi:MAG: hypothetical protein HFE88_06425 [Acutalibacter sp.]|nr:hypothetical protein [Acutalibacter sp.]
MSKHETGDKTASRPSLWQRAGKVIKRSLLLCIPALLLNLFFQGRREFKKPYQ